MFNAGLLDMVANDPHKHVWFGSYGPMHTHGALSGTNYDYGISSGHINAAATLNGGTAGVTEIGSGNAAFATHNPGGNNITQEVIGWEPVYGGQPTGGPGVGSAAPYWWIPEQSWKYYPQGLRLKYSTVRRRVFYNPTNLVAYVFVNELRRKRTQYYALTDFGLIDGEAVGIQYITPDPIPDARVKDSTNAARTEVQTDREVLDLLPMGDPPRTSWWIEPIGLNSTGGLAFAVPYYKYCTNNMAGSNVPGTNIASIVKLIANSGEYLKRFLKPLFGQYDYLRSQLGDMYADHSVQGETNGDAFLYNRTGSDASFWPDLQRVPYMPGITGANNQVMMTYGYVKPQNTAPYTNVTTDTVNTAFDESQNNVDFTTAPWFNPKKNPFMKRLFYIKRRAYMIPPGGTATHTVRSRGYTSPLRGSLMQCIPFFDSQPSVGGALPYIFPFADYWKPPEPLYTTKRRNGFGQVDLWCQVRGQMAFNNQSGAQANPMQWVGTQVTYHDKLVNRWKVCSYNKRRVQGGTQGRLTGLSTDLTLGHYTAQFPTATPATATATDPVQG